MKLFIGGLKYTVTPHELKEEFGNFGEVVHAKVVTDEAGQSKGFGFVTFKTAESAKEAMSKLDGQTVLGRKVSVREAIEKQARRQTLNS